MKMDVAAMSGRKARGRTPHATTADRTKGSLRFKSLLVPIDFSETSLAALDYALTLAGEFGSQLRLLHVLEPPAVFNSEYPDYAIWDKVASDNAKSRLDALVNERIDELIPACAEVKLGRAYKRICAMARNQNSDLIVIGTHGFTGLKHLFLGSTAEKVIRHAPCSVLVVRPLKERIGKSVVHPKKILVPTDFSAPAKLAFQSAIALAKQYNAQIHLLHVVPVHYAVGDMDQIDYRLLEADLKETGQKELAAMSKMLLAKKIQVVTRLGYGRPATEITEAAKEIGADLILIATQGHTGWERALLGSTTEEVVRHATCPVLVVRNK